MNNVYTLNKDEIPYLLKEISDPPKKLYIKGKLPKEGIKMLCIVGARKHSSYGEEVCKKLISGLKGYNICIVSGLAIGIDAIAHRAALDAELQTIAFPGSGLNDNVLYPRSHARLADEILYAGGAILSEFEMDQEGAPWTFPLRNRLMAGISHATLVIEAELISGTLITSRLATEYNRDVCAVPGPITSKLSEGPHMLIRLGATPITCPEDILEMLGFNRPEKNDSENLNNKNNIHNNIQKNLLLNLSENERKIIEILQIESMTNEAIIMKSGLSAKEVNEAISSLEIQGLIKEKNGKFYPLP